jgi:hypothetical protein
VADHLGNQGSGRCELLRTCPLGHVLVFVRGLVHGDVHIIHVLQPDQRFLGD